MDATTKIWALWFLFAATHMGLSSLGLRPRLVALVGERGFAGLYSVVALVIFVPLVSIYWAHKHSGALLWQFGHSAPLIALQLGLMLFAFFLLVAGMASPSPAAMQLAGGATAESEPARPGGVHLICRHAVFMAVAIFGLAHLLVNGFASDVAFFGGFLVFSVVGAWHQDRRKLVTLGESYRVFYEGTPFVPLTGKETLRGLREIPWYVVVGGIGVGLLIRQFHSTLFG